MVVMIPYRYSFYVPITSESVRTMVPQCLKLDDLFTDDLRNLDDDNFSKEYRKGIGEVYLVRSYRKDEVERAHTLLSEAGMPVSPIDEEESERPSVWPRRR